MSVRFQTTARARAWLLCLACAVVFAADKRTGWAVGAGGVILHTSDGGFRWEEQHTPAPVPLYGLYVRDPRRAVAVGSRGLALTTDDGGRRWTLRPTNPKEI